MEKEKIETYYQNAAKRIIDVMFDNKIFNEKVTRNDMQGFEDLIAFELQCQANLSKKIAEFSVKYNL